MQIVVRMPGGAHLGVNLNSTCSINELKEKISEMDGVPVENQRLLFCSKELSNEETLEDGSVLDMEFALHGGIGPSDIADHLKELARGGGAGGGGGGGGGAGRPGGARGGGEGK